MSDKPVAERLQVKGERRLAVVGGPGIFLARQGIFSACQGTFWVAQAIHERRLV